MHRDVVKGRFGRAIAVIVVGLELDLFILVVAIVIKTWTDGSTASLSRLTAMSVGP